MDIFFIIGATLVPYPLLKDLDKTNCWANPKVLLHAVIFYVNRIIRITVHYGLMILFLIGVMPLIITDPIQDANYVYIDTSACKNIGKL